MSLCLLRFDRPKNISILGQSGQTIFHVVSAHAQDIVSRLILASFRLRGSHGLFLALLHHVYMVDIVLRDGREVRVILQVHNDVSRGTSWSNPFA